MIRRGSATSCSPISAAIVPLAMAGLNAMTALDATTRSAFRP
jgi:hypothetical protein